MSDSEEMVQKYVCKEHKNTPSGKSLRPGKCLICGEDLEEAGLIKESEAQNWVFG
ncbi:hypothetical protein ACFL13_00065 [Patescibacteria group bacterium]